MSTLIDRQDGLSSATAWKGPCRVATTENIALEGLITVDGIVVEVDDRVLVKDQTDARFNGIYVVDTGNWRRSKDFSRNGDVIKGTRVAVTSGTHYENNTFQVVSENPIDVGESNIIIDMIEDVAGIADTLIQWTPLKFEAIGDGIADDLPALQAAIDFLAASTPGAADKQYAYCKLDLAGRTFAISDQLIVHGPVNPLRRLFLKIENGGIVAHPSFAAQAPGTAPRPMIIFQDSAYGAILENVYVDCAKKSSGICIVPSSRTSRHIHIYKTTIRRFLNPLLPLEAAINLTGESPPLPETNPLRPYGIRIGTLDTLADNPPSSMCTIENNNIAQWDNNDTEGNDWNNYTGIGISLHAIDSKVRFNAIDSVRKGIVVRGWNNEISFNHPSPPTPAVYDVDHSSERISGIEIAQYGNNRIIGNYVDNGFITLYQKNQIIIGNFFSRNPSTTFANSAGICFIATEANEVIDNDMVVSGNQLMDTLTYLYSYIERAPFSFAAKIGNGSVSQLVDIGYRQRTIARFSTSRSPLLIVTAGTQSMTQFKDASQTTTVFVGSEGNNFKVLLDSADGMTLWPGTLDLHGKPISNSPMRHIPSTASMSVGSAQTNASIVDNAGSGTTYTLAKTAAVGTYVKFTRRNGTVTLSPESGAKINAATSNVSVTANRCCTALVTQNGDGNSAEWTLEGSFS